MLFGLEYVGLATTTEFDYHMTITRSRHTMKKAEDRALRVVLLDGKPSRLISGY